MGWERRFVVAPRITTDVAEYDAAKLSGTSLRVERVVREGFDKLGIFGKRQKKEGS